MTLSVGGILLVPIVVALIEVAKQFGLPKKFAPWLNAGLSVAGFVIMRQVQFNPELEETVVFVLQALTVFLSAAGLYSEGVKRGKKVLS